MVKCAKICSSTVNFGERKMIEWIDYNVANNNPPRHRALLAYCPDWCDFGYAVVVWNGANFEDEIRGEDIHDYVKKWCLIYEAD